MSRTNSSVCLQHCCICRASAHIKNGKRKLCSRRRHCSNRSHHRLHSGHNRFYRKLLLKMLCNLLHGKMLCFNHCCNSHCFFHTGFSRKRTGNFHRCQSIYRQNIGNTNILFPCFSYIFHTGFNPPKHISHICVSLSVNIPDFSRILKGFHDSVRSCINVDRELLVSMKCDFSCRKNVFFHISVRRLNNDCASLSHKTFCNRSN